MYAYSEDSEFEIQDILREDSSTMCQKVTFQDILVDINARSVWNINEFCQSPKI